VAGRAAAHRAAVQGEPSAVQRTLQAVVEDLALGQERAGVRAAQPEGVQGPAGPAQHGGQPLDPADLAVGQVAVRAHPDQPRVVAAAPSQNPHDAQHDAAILSHIDGPIQHAGRRRERDLELDSVMGPGFGRRTPSRTDNLFSHVTGIDP
jgi:hypothetical protein